MATTGIFKLTDTYNQQQQGLWPTTANGTSITSYLFPNLISNVSYTAVAGNANVQVSIYMLNSLPGFGQIHNLSYAPTAYYVTANTNGLSNVLTYTTSNIATFYNLTKGNVYNFYAFPVYNSANSLPSYVPNVLAAVKTAPGSPAVNTAIATGFTTANVSFFAPTDTGGNTITTYTVTSSPGGFTGTSSQAGTVTISGLSKLTSYTFTISATNSIGVGTSSSASNSITTLIDSVYSWGVGTYGGLGLGNTTNYSSPKAVGSTVRWANVSTYSASSSYMTGGLATDGTLWAWGANYAGQLGLNNRTYYSTPKQIGVLTSWSSFSVGSDYVLAARTDGTLWTWGNNTRSQLGVGNQTRYSSPKQVGALTNWKTVAAANQFTGAVKTDGTLWMWGWNNYGALGLGNTTYAFSSPQQVGSLTNWREGSGGGANGNSSSFVKTDGTLWTWGSNSRGELGLGNRSYYSSPKQVGALTNWLRVSSGIYYRLAIKTDGTLWAWGGANTGGLGVGNGITYYSSPKQVGALTNWLIVSAGKVNSLATKTDGTLWTWGTDSSGSLGTGSATTITSPVQLGALTNWKTSMTGGAISMAINTN